MGNLIVNPAVPAHTLNTLHNKTQLKYINKQNTQQTAAEATAASQNQEMPAGLNISSHTASYMTETDEWSLLSPAELTIGTTYIYQIHNNT